MIVFKKLAEIVVFTLMAGSKCLCPFYPWPLLLVHGTMPYDASLAVSQQRHTLSCSFTMTGPQGTGILHLKAVRNGGNFFYMFFLTFGFPELSITERICKKITFTINFKMKFSLRRDTTILDQQSLNW